MKYFLTVSLFFSSVGIALGKALVVAIDAAKKIKSSLSMSFSSGYLFFGVFQETPNMLKRFLPILQVNLSRVIRAVKRRSFYTQKAKKWYVYAAQAIFLVVFPVCVEAGEPFPFQVVVPEYDHGLFVSPEFFVENIPVTERLSLQGMNSIIESRSESISGDIESTASKNMQGNPSRNNDANKCSQCLDDKSNVDNIFLLFIPVAFAIESSYATCIWLIYGRK